MTVPIAHPSLSSTALLPAQVHAYFLHSLPPGESPGPFIEVAAQAYFYALALYFSRPAAGRPACTLENVLAAVRYGEPEQVIGLLQREPACVSWTLQMAEEITRGAYWQIQAVLHFIDIVLNHVQPTQAVEQQVHAYLRAHVPNA